jgi:hypothetical protein
LRKQHLETTMNQSNLEDLISDALRKVYRFASEITMRLSASPYANPSVPADRLLSQSALVTQRVLAAMKDHHNGISIAQSRHDPAGVLWVNTSWAQFMSAVSRLVFDPAFDDDHTKDLVTGEGFSAMDAINRVMVDSRLNGMPVGPSSNLALAAGNVVELQAGNHEPTATKNQRIECPVESCASSFGTTKALRAHMKKFHSESEDQLLTITGQIIDSKRRVRCALCEHENMVETIRMKDHLVGVHRKGPYSRLHKVCH